MDTSGSHPQSAVTWVYEHSTHKGNVQFVLVTLAIAYGEKGACLSMKEIAKRTGISQATVRRALDTLQADGTIQIIKNGGEKRGNGVTNCYRFPGYEGLHGDTSQPDTSHHETSQGATPAINAVPHARAHGDAAGEKDLSEEQKAKEKDKKPLSPIKAGDSQAIPKQSIRPLRKPNPLFDAIMLHIFGIAPDNTAQFQANAPRVGKMLAGFPAEKDTLTGERIAQFGRWWNANKKTPDGKPLNKPLTAEKLATHWSEFEKAQPVKSLESAQAAARRQEENRAQLEQEHRRIQREMLGMTV